MKCKICGGKMLLHKDIIPVTTYSFRCQSCGLKKYSDIAFYLMCNGYIRFAKGDNYVLREKDAR